MQPTQLRNVDFMDDPSIADAIYITTGLFRFASA